MNRSLLPTLILSLVLLVPVATHAQSAAAADGSTTLTAQTQTDSNSGYVPIAPIPGLTQNAVASSKGLADFLNNLYRYLVGLAATLAVILIIWGGLEISTQDSISSKSAGRERITQAIIGLVLVLSPVLVFSLINPAILNLSINLQPLHTKWGKWVNPETAPPPPSYENSTNGSAYQNGTIFIACMNGSCSSAAQQCVDNTPGFETADAQAVCITPGGAIDTNFPPATGFFGTASSASSCPVKNDILKIQCSYHSTMSSH